LGRIRRFFDLRNKTEAERKTFHPFALLAMATVVIVAWQFYYGRLAMYPFTLYSTWFHEMSHGLAAMLCGGHFIELVVNWNGSGVAYSTVPADHTWVSTVFRSLAGPVGPSIAGAILIMVGRSKRWSKFILYALAATMLLSALLLVRSILGFCLISALALVVLYFARWTNPALRVLFTQFLGVQAAISLYYDIGYFFSESATIAGKVMISDTGHAAQATGIPVAFWAVAVIAFNVLMLAAALAWSFWPSRSRL